MTRTIRRTSRKKYDDYDEQRKEHIGDIVDNNTPSRKHSAVDTKTVGLAGMMMFLMTNFKKEIGQILTAISKFIGGS